MSPGAVAERGTFETLGQRVGASACVSVQTPPASESRLGGRLSSENFFPCRSLVEETDLDVRPP